MMSVNVRPWMLVMYAASKLDDDELVHCLLTVDDEAKLSLIFGAILLDKKNHELHHDNFKSLVKSMSVDEIVQNIIRNRDYILSVDNTPEPKKWYQ